ncbi:MAG: hypothetical protein COA79_11650 [Planctomycetota bacterium]|nr:MAG: hypothetical protein COA79_11650 [Planctomycetota bacterium]
MKYILPILLFLISCGSNNSSTNEKNNKTATLDNNKLSKKYTTIEFNTLNSYTIHHKPAPSPFDQDDGFNFEDVSNDGFIDNQVPKKIKKLSGENIQITGFVFPVVLNGEQVQSLVLMSVIPSCCFGDVLSPNDLIFVDSTSDMKILKQDQKITIKGKFKVGMSDAAKNKGKFLYWLKADSIELK